MQPVDAAHAHNPLDLGEADGRHGMVDVGVALGEVEGEDGGVVEVVLGEELVGLLPAVDVLDVLFRREVGPVDAVCELAALAALGGGLAGHLGGLGGVWLADVVSFWRREEGFLFWG